MVQCTQKFVSMDSTYKEDIKDMITKYATKFGSVSTRRFKKQNAFASLVSLLQFLRRLIALLLAFVSVIIFKVKP